MWLATYAESAARLRSLLSPLICVGERDTNLTKFSKFSYGSLFFVKQFLLSFIHATKSIIHYFTALQTYLVILRLVMEGGFQFPYTRSEHGLRFIPLTVSLLQTLLFFSSTAMYLLFVVLQLLHASRDDLSFEISVSSNPSCVRLPFHVTPVYVTSNHRLYTD